MDESEVPQLADAVKASFEPIMKAIDAERAQLLETKDVVAVRPGYKYPPNEKKSWCRLPHRATYIFSGRIGLGAVLIAKNIVAAEQVRAR